MAEALVRVCDACGEKIDPGLFGKPGKSVYYLARREGSERVSACSLCGSVTAAPLYELAKPTPRYQSNKSGWSSKKRKGRNDDE